MVSTQQPSDAETSPETTPKKRRICPYLGLFEDRTMVAGTPMEAHACFAKRRRFRPSLDHQSAFCLSGRFPTCRYYPDRVSEVPSELYTLERERSNKKWYLWVLALVVLLLIVAAVLAYVSGYKPSGLPNLLIAPIVSGRAGAVETATPTLATKPALTPRIVRNRTAPRNATAMPNPTVTRSPTVTPHPTETPIPTPTPTIFSTPIAVTGSVRNRVTISATPSILPNISTPQTITPTRVSSGQVLDLTPGPMDVGWWVSGGTLRGTIGDSFLYAGFFQNQAYVSAVHFDLLRVPRGSEIISGTLRLTGIQDDRLNQDANMSWLVQLVAGSALPRLSGADLLTVFGASSAITLSPQLVPSDLAAGRVNEWILRLKNARLVISAGARWCNISFYSNSAVRRGWKRIVCLGQWPGFSVKQQRS